MSFHQNTSNQRAPQEQSDPDANSSPALWWTGVPPYAPSVGDAAPFDEQIESNTSYFSEFNNDNNSDLRSNGLVSFSIEESIHGDWHNSNEGTCGGALYFGEYQRVLSEFNKIKVLKGSIEKSRGMVLSGVKTSEVHGIALRVTLKAQKNIIKFLAKELPKHGYCPHFKSDLEIVEQHINTSIGFIKENTFQNEKDAREIEATVESIQQNIETLKAWDRKRSFLCGQSEKFANVVCAKDLLPQNDGPTTCGICLFTIEEKSNFAVQSDCPHIFCTLCLITWYKEKQNCPMCRQSGLIMTKDRLLHLRSRGPKPPHRRRQLGEECGGQHNFS